MSYKMFGERILHSFRIEYNSNNLILNNTVLERKIRIKKRNLSRHDIIVCYNVAAREDENVSIKLRNRELFCTIKKLTLRLYYMGFGSRHITYRTSDRVANLLEIPLLCGIRKKCNISSCENMDRVAYRKSNSNIMISWRCPEHFNTYVDSENKFAKIQKIYYDKRLLTTNSFFNKKVYGQIINQRDFENSILYFFYPKSVYEQIKKITFEFEIKYIILAVINNILENIRIVTYSEIEPNEYAIYTEHIDIFEPFYNRLFTTNSDALLMHKQETSFYSQFSLKDYTYNNHKERRYSNTGFVVFDHRVLRTIQHVLDKYEARNRVCTGYLFRSIAEILELDEGYDCRLI